MAGDEPYQSEDDEIACCLRVLEHGSSEQQFVARLRLGAICERRGLLRNAAAAYEANIAAGMHTRDLYERLSAVYRRLGDIDRAEDLLDEALSLPPSGSPAAISPPSDDVDGHTDGTCGVCGASTRETARFCDSCGHQIGSTRGRRESRRTSRSTDPTVSASLWATRSDELPILQPDSRVRPSGVPSSAQGHGAQPICPVGGHSDKRLSHVAASLRGFAHSMHPAMSNLPVW
jgi:tetratricopeptide (TPR) repeat protein